METLPPFVLIYDRNMETNFTSPSKTEVVLHAQDYMQVLKSRWKLIFFVFILVFVSSAVITKMMTPKYQSGMSFEIKQPRDLINVAVGGEGNPIAAMADGAAYMHRNERKWKCMSEYFSK